MLKVTWRERFGSDLDQVLARVSSGVKAFARALECRVQGGISEDLPSIDDLLFGAIVTV